MTPADLSRTVVRALRRAVEEGGLPAGTGVPERVVVDRTRPGGVGEYATAVAFQVAKSAGIKPAEAARVIAGLLVDVPGIERVEITGAGFLNFVLAERSAAELVREVRERGNRYGFAPDGEIRARVVAEAVQRIVRSQGQGQGQGQGQRQAGAGLRVAPVARRDGDVVAAYGADAAAWAMLTVAPHETPSFSPRLLVQDESANEFFRVRYAYARSRALTVNAARLGFRGEPGAVGEGEGGGALLRALRDYPLVLEAAAHHRAPERLVRHLVELADALLDFQYRVLPAGDEKPSAAHRARLALAEAAGTVLAGGLALLGIDAPDCL
ncbi:ArgS-related anticodon-binding protein NrtL [Streptomyces sp. NBC_01565]|uniref:ArgS-related anticodon-binding protein NrtL n=1 Tax=unclassified Streptomyces TaxID=2593676 RepID=UPI00224EEA1B|nr:DALR anticodon-binding domain-containing protein [Streptomyces sp. NBC_01565]MCX4541285.1 DALR anticodon-binding domain-containing protein [Streptomyces sp. NBC_01565]